MSEKNNSKAPGSDDLSDLRGRLISILSGIEGIEIVDQGEDGRESRVFNRELKPDMVFLKILIHGDRGTRARKDERCPVFV